MGKDSNFISEIGKFFTERLWQALLDLVAEIAEIFGIDDDNVFDILVNKSDQLNHFVNFYKLK